MHAQESEPLPIPATALTHQLALQIGELIRAGALAPGARLAERKLAEQLRVSRSPVRSALRLLENNGLVKTSAGGGFAVSDVPDGDIPPIGFGASDEDQYQAIATDRLDGILGDRVTERDLARRYGMTRTDVQRILNRISSEGWIERLPGHGWAFSQTLTSLESYRDSYRFRLTIEPAAILEHSFVLNRENVAACRAQQQTLVDGDIWSVSSARLFDLNSAFHEAVIECSNNAFFIEALKRINRLRRLIDYRQELDRGHAIVRCREHVRIADLLLAGKRDAAADLMRRHLRSVGVEKTTPR